ncbi:MAG TPA: IS5 family transposase [Stellaceae bacterium]|nr:IS5 family transposase [Stellaceae bacterium]
MQSTRKPYPSDVSDDEWSFVAPYLCLLPEDAAQRRWPLREVFNGLRWIVRTGAQWRLMPYDLPPWWVVQQQGTRWTAAGVFAALIEDLRILLRRGVGRAAHPSAAIWTVGPCSRRRPFDRLRSGGRAGYDGAKRKKGSKVHLAVDTFGHLLALHITPANEQDRAQIDTLAAAVQEATGERVEIAFVDQAYTGQATAEEAEGHGIRLVVVKTPEAKRGFVLLPRRWVAERSFAWTARFRRLVRDYERLPETLAALHLLAFACLMVKNVVPLLASGP